jgi:lipoprotein NlpD
MRIGWRPGRLAAATCAALALAACASRTPAPVVKRAPPPPESTMMRPAAPAAKAPAPAPARTDAAPGSAPAVERDTRPEIHVVRKGDTLLSIALEYGLDYRDLAAWNRLENINLIRAGQALRLRPPGDSTTLAPVDGPVVRPAEVRPPGKLARAVPLPDPDGVRTEPRALRQPFSDRALSEASAAARRPADPKNVRPDAIAAPVAPAAALPDPVLPPRPDAAASPGTINWGWPASGTLIERFSDTNRGIDIGGKAGQPILASADGRVVYSGSAIRGYGRMLIVKHNDQYVSVYAHAAELLVKEGQSVSRGQRIAEMGSTDADRVKLHFEIRRMGRPIDPLRYLPGEGAS